jgi:hypothetical protein
MHIYSRFQEVYVKKFVLQLLGMQKMLDFFVIPKILQ